jgi:hypothetical protein
MDREKICKARYGITLDQRMGQTQSWLLAGPQTRGVAAVVEIATAQRPLLLQTVSMDSDQVGGVITSFRVSGQEVNVGTGNIPIGCFDPASGGTSAATRVLGIAVNNNQTVEIQATQSAAGNSGFSIGALPIASQDVPSTAEQADFYSYVCGLGVTAAMAVGGGIGACTANVLRATWLGEIVFVNQNTGTGLVADSNIVLTDLLVNGLSMLGGAQDQEIPLSHLVAAQSSTRDFILNTWVPANSTVTANFTNNDAANTAVVGAAIFCQPFPAPTKR